MKTSIIAFLSCITFSLFGQKVHFGIEGGFNAVKSAFSSEPAFEDFTFSYKKSFIIGIPLEINISQYFNLHSGLYYSHLGTHGRKEANNNLYVNGVEDRIDKKIYSIILPINYKVNIPVKSIELFAGFGAQLQYNISGCRTTYLYFNNRSISDREIKIHAKDMAQFAMGMDLFLGLETKFGVFGKLFYSHGLTVVDIRENHNEKQQQLGMTAGFMF